MNNYADWIAAATEATVQTYRDHQASAEAVGLPPTQGRGFMYLDVPAPLGKPEHVRAARLEVDSRKARTVAALLVHLRDGTSERHPVEL